MNKHWIALLLLPLLMPKTFAGENLLPDPEFDQSIKTARWDYTPGTFKITRITEPQTWNKALRLEYLKPMQKEGKPDSCYAGIFWGKEKNGGVPVKPDTIYQFSIELKGNLPPESAYLLALEWTGDDFWKDRRRLRIDGGSILKKFTVSPNEYQVLKGTFRTGSQAKRATFGIVVRGNSKSGNLPHPGDWLLVDRISLKEVPAQISPQKALQPVKLRECRLLTCGEPAQSGFTGLRSRQDAGKETTVAVNAGENAFEVIVSGIHSPRQDFIQGDRMEIIFDPALHQKNIRHFAISFDGRRSSAGKPAAGDASWSGKVIPGEKNIWQAQFSIPYTTLGLSKAEVKTGILIGFNAACYRKQGLRFFSWNPIDRDFHNPNLFGRILTGDGYFKKETDRLGKEIPEKSAKAAEIRKKLTAIQQFSDNQKKFDALRRLEQEIRLSRIGDQIFLLAECLPASDFEIPVLPDSYSKTKENFEVCAAGNEIRPLTLLLSNVSGSFEDYRVSVSYPGKVPESELPGLISATGKIFPAEKINMLRGVQVKDGEGKKPGRRFDPLIPAGPAGIYSVPANGSGLIWINFDTSGVPPGRYSGVIRVVPLSEPMTKTKSSPPLSYPGQWRDFPLTIEVMDFQLASEPVKPLNMFSRAENEEMFRMMAQLGIRDFLFHPLNFQMSFNADGSLRNFDMSKAEKTLADLQHWAANCGISKTMRFSVTYSLYPRFMNLWGKKNFKVNTPEWKKGWSECVKAIAGAFCKLKIPPEKYSIELWDEPPPGRFEELYEAARVAKEAAPELRWMVTFDSRMLSGEKLRRLSPFIDIWVFWGKGYFTIPDYAAFVETLRQDPNKEIGYYTCYTSMRQHLNEYYRLHALWAWAYKLNNAAFYQFIDAPQNNTGLSNWRSSCLGGIAYFAGGHTIPSIRMECLRLGHTDIKYFQLLDSLVKQNPRHPAAAESAAFLVREPLETLLKHPFDSQRPEQLRKQCMEFIMKFKEIKK